MKVVLLFMFFSGVTTFSQTFDQTAIGISYRYIDRNVLQLSLEQSVKTSTKAQYILGAAVIYASAQGKSKVLPEIHSYYVNELALVGLSVNPYAIEPRLGFSIFNGIYLTSGYAIPIDHHQYFKGITLGIQINFALTKYSKFYDHLKLF